jgi:hypothetical protein
MKAYFPREQITGIRSKVVSYAQDIQLASRFQPPHVTLCHYTILLDDFQCATYRACDRQLSRDLDTIPRCHTITPHRVRPSICTTPDVPAYKSANLCRPLSFNLASLEAEPLRAVTRRLSVKVPANFGLVHYVTGVAGCGSWATTYQSSL